jgi:uncharacterized protein YjlB
MPNTQTKMTSIKLSKPQSFMFTDDGLVPNNAKLPFLLYRNVFDFIGKLDVNAVVEDVFRKNGWGNLWRNGILDYVHYHSMIHECMGIARGRARVRFGGNKGREIELRQGDAVVLPAGTGHHCLANSTDLMVIGAYAMTGQYNLCRDSKGEHDKALDAIPLVPKPNTDPIFGKDGPLMSLWPS